MDTARTGRYVLVRSLPGGTVVWGCFCPVMTQNRLVTVNFGRRRLLSGSNGRFRPSVADFGRYQPREKKRENLESGAGLPIPIRRPRGKIKYVVRPVLPPGCQAVSSYCSAVGSSDAVNLGGYGVELALKNMEYKAMDDTMIKEGNISF
ncbi:hypothetical protein B296_00004302 [Ensete ventricosum]|uniref:Uncharacterized protein n=1 Tax=Ensete ventricosum TaxID=4639 RepID=A0A427B646_ENSVE|nr:hypothetical protein B296_00004302 [Ensete ventricosum]